MSLSDVVSDERFVWFLMRGSGVVLLVVLTAAVVLGAVSSLGGAARPGAPSPTGAALSGVMPRFAMARVHRDVSLTGLTLLAIHALSAGFHSYVDISWVDLVVPFTSTYETLSVGLGTAALDLLVVASVAAALRDRLGPRSWRLIHLTTYAAWAISLVHTVTIGTDRQQIWGIGVGAACLLAFVVACIIRLAWVRRAAVHPGAAERDFVRNARGGRR